MTTDLLVALEAVMQHFYPETASAEQASQDAYAAIARAKATPTSSLEEARREVQATQQHAGECALMKDATAFDCTCYSWLILTLYGEIAKAAARAEVIREVEAVRHNEIAWVPDTLGREAMAANRGWNKAIDAILRALSQGGEGEAR